MTITDFHSHRHDADVVNLTPARYAPVSNDDTRLFTVGIHPWDTATATDSDLRLIAKAMTDRRVIALGEAGIDPLRGAPVDRQLELLAAQLKIAAETGKPVVLHIVKRFDLLLSLCKELPHKPMMAIHGFRGKPRLARQLADKGFYISLGRHFNPATAREIPSHLLLAETDDDPGADIADVIALIAEARSEDRETLRETVTANAGRFYGTSM